MGIFKANEKYTGGRSDAGEQRRVTGTKQFSTPETIRYRHAKPDSLIGETCPCDELVRSNTSEVHYRHYACLFCRFITKVLTDSHFIYEDDEFA